MKRVGCTVDGRNSAPVGGLSNYLHLFTRCDRSQGVHDYRHQQYVLIMIMDTGFR